MVGLGGCGRSSTELAERESIERPSPPAEASWFTDATADSAIDFTYRNGWESAEYSIAEVLGGGVGVLDFDHDGHCDFFLVGGGTIVTDQPLRGHPNGLFRARGGVFQNVAAVAGAAEAPHYGHGVAVADYDSDGFSDLLLTGYGGLVLLRNQGDGTFVSVTATAGLHDRAWSTAAGWGDVDGDGHLDLYVTHYVDWSWDNNPDCFAGGDQREVCTPLVFEGLDDVLYRSTGDGRFEDISDRAGLIPKGKGLGVTLLDFNGDDHLDIYVANDTDANYLYHNRGDGTFTENAVTGGAAFGARGMADGSMGLSVLDYNGDGRPDLWVSNYENNTFALYRNDGGGNYTHASGVCGLSAIGTTYVGWGTVTDDLDNDGDLDIVVTNGHVLRMPAAGTSRQRPLVLIGKQQRFELLSIDPSDYLGQAHDGRGLAKCDFDNDGDWDLAFTHLNAPFRLLRNDLAPRTPWVGVRLIGRNSNRDAIGTSVTLEQHPGGQRSTRFRFGGGSYLSSSDPRMRWSLRPETTAVQLQIRWPDGRRETRTLSDFGRYHTLIQGLSK
ncbi:CRTAC1 family protein [Roseimaritima sediminicola]|uniref:CRTAC1 family protein n=1 Tax=Roseimaritima sediminicola TaxID=2662066 RepID=UPI0013867637|nr:CRTAC1 family protein [Roseimaritima sediminicola]